MDELICMNYDIVVDTYMSYLQPPIFIIVNRYQIYI